MNESQWHSDTDIKNDNLLTPQQAAEFLQVPVRWLQKRVAQGTVPCHRLSKMKVRFDRTELRQWRKERP